ncbi:STAS domain-containing protein [Rhizobium sp. SSA_523]|uniref:STAS domain-containing protein n=1 Tax=Rhizobium sp. SSA_523 TaxID=2952477 RepID=UPI00345E966F
MVSSLTLQLDGNLTLRSISAHQERLLSALSQHGLVELDLAGDAQFDLSFLQLLESARIYAGTAGRVVRLSRAADGSLLDLLDRAGFLSAMTAQDRHFWLHEGVTA